MPKKLHAYFYFIGVFKTKVNNTTFLMKNYGYQFHVENELFWGGIDNGWEKESTKLWVKLCENKTNIVDVGANTGFYSVLAKAISPQSNVFAFEPMPLIMQKLQFNNKLNNYNFNCQEIALSNFNGEAKIFPTSLDHVYSVTVNKNLGDKPSVFEVTIKTKKLSDFIEENKIENIDLMKIDVETHEVEVLEGMGKYLQLMQPDMLIEVQTDEIANGINNLIKNINYQFYNIDEKTGIRKVDKLGKSDTLNYLVCKPETALRLGIK